VIEGKLTIEEAQVSPLRTILVNAIGVSADVGVEMAHVTLKRGDRLLLCSDGLHDYFPVDEEIAQRLSEDKPGDALAAMVELAKTRGGHDNITGVAVQVLDVVDGVPGATDGESTAPVDLEGNPFAADEPTETAFLPGTPLPVRVTEVSPSSLRQTQPMRAADVTEKEKAELEVGDTIPPEVGKKLAAAAIAAAAAAADDKAEAKSDGTVSADIATADTGRIEAAKVEAARLEAERADAEKAAAAEAKPDEPKPDEAAKPDEPAAKPDDAH
jgi:hypothetical protein